MLVQLESDTDFSQFLKTENDRSMRGLKKVA